MRLGSRERHAVAELPVLRERGPDASGRKPVHDGGDGASLVADDDHDALDPFSKQAAHGAFDERAPPYTDERLRAATGHPGEALGVSLLFNGNAEPRALFVHKRLREYPLRGGPSTLRESVVRPTVAELGTRLLRALNWYGVAMVEFKVDPRDGVPKLMEVNPKLWGSLSLAIASGVDFPALLYRLAIEGDIEPVFDYRVGVRCRFLLGDVLHFLANPDRFRLQPSFFRFGDAATHGDIWDWRDPTPAFGLGFLLLRHGWRPGFLRHVLLRSRPTAGAAVQRSEASPALRISSKQP